MSGLERAFFGGSSPLEGHKVRTAWYVVFRVLREEGVLDMSERGWAMLVNEVLAYGWKDASFRNVPTSLKLRSIARWRAAGEKELADFAEDVRAKVRGQLPYFFAVYGMVTCKSVSGGYIFAAST